MLLDARRSHCIPHRFKDETFILHTTKCNMCNTAIQMKGLRCVRTWPSLYYTDMIADFFFLNFFFFFWRTPDCEYSCHHKCSSKAPPNCGLADLTTVH